MANHALSGLVGLMETRVLTDFMALGAQGPARRGESHYGASVRGDGLMAIIAAHLDCGMDKLPLIFGRMAFETDCGF